MKFTDQGERARKARIIELNQRLQAVIRVHEVAIATMEDPSASEHDLRIATRELDESQRSIEHLRLRRDRLVKLGSATQ